jgi:hypothetical protein
MWVVLDAQQLIASANAISRHRLRGGTGPVRPVRRQCSSGKEEIAGLLLPAG